MAMTTKAIRPGKRRAPRQEPQPRSGPAAARNPAQAERNWTNPFRRPIAQWASHQMVGHAPSKMVLVLIAADSTKIEGEYRIYITVDTLNQACSMTIAGRCLRLLEEKGFIARRRGVHPETGRRCNYYVMLADL